MWPRWSINVSALLLVLSVSAGQVAAHGYVSSPPSRASLCKLGKAKDCGAIQYEPQSVEAPKGMPFKVSGNGPLCSGGVDRFLELDKQGAKAWPHQTASSLDSFSWTILANHRTTDFSYYMTKPDWDSTKSSGLVASDLESTPFLKVPMNGKPPANLVTHKVDKLPSRTGYHMVYAVWTIADTGNAFYQCIDLDFGGSNSNSNSNKKGTDKKGGNHTNGGKNPGSKTSTVRGPSGTSSKKDPSATGRCKFGKSRRGVYKRADYRRPKPSK